jgi:hypothetical protein
MKESEFNLSMVAYGGIEELISFVKFFGEDISDSANYFAGYRLNLGREITPGIRCNFEIWNHSEYESRFRSRGESQPFRGKHTIIIPIDVTEEEAFKTLERRLTMVDRYSSEDVKKCIVPINLNNTSKKPTIKQEDLKEFTDMLNIPCYFEWESDIGTTEKVDKFLTSLARPVLENLLEMTLEEFESYNKLLPADEFKGILRGIEKYTNGELKQSIMERKLQEQTNLNGETWASKTKTEPQVTKGQILKMLNSYPDAVEKYGLEKLYAAGLKHANEHAEERSDKERCVIC